jgi:hypothetical protein
MYEDLFQEAVENKKLSFGPNSINMNDITTVGAKIGKQRFQRSTSAEQAAVEFTIMGLCDEFHGTSGSTVIHWVKWIHRKYNSGPEYFELIGSWRAGGATTMFKKHMGEIAEKAVNHIIIPNDFTLVHEQANVLDFLSTHHLQQIYDVIVSALSQPPHHVLAEDFIKKTLLTKCMVARLNKERYFTASKKNKDLNDIAELIDWFKALNQYRLKAFAMSLPAPAWWFNVNDKNILRRIPMPPHLKKEEKKEDSPPPWRRSSTGSASSTTAPWHEPEEKKRRLDN